MAGSVPLVVVEGFLSVTAGALFGNYEAHMNIPSEPQRLVIFPNIGPVSSLHDRACELYYFIRGGRVDYGLEHSQEFGHGRYGRTHTQGSYPQWSKSNPLHFIGHSIGGATIMKLAYLIRTGFFEDQDHPDMITSIATVSAPLRGSSIVYALGERPESAPDVRFFSVGSFLAKSIHALSYFSPLLPAIAPLDFHAEAWALSCRESSFMGFLSQLWKSDWAEGKDAAPYDCTFLGAEERELNNENNLNPKTFYRSYASVLTDSLSQPSPSNTSILLKFPLYYFGARAIANFNYSLLVPRPAFVPPSSTATVSISPPSTFLKSLISIPPFTRNTPPSYSPDDSTTKQALLLEEARETMIPPMGNEYWANDGIVPFFSQWHTGFCSPLHCTHERFDSGTPVRNPTSTKLSPTPAHWYVNELVSTGHASLLPLWVGSDLQKAFWVDFGCWLRALECRGSLMPPP